MQYVVVWVDFYTIVICFIYMSNFLESDLGDESHVVNVNCLGAVHTDAK